MIDVENYIFNKIAVPLRDKYEGIFITGEASQITADSTSFPAISIVQQTNTVKASTSDNQDLENHVDVMFEVDVYSNIVSGKKTQAKKITSEIDNIFIGLGFTRSFCEPVSNLENVTIYRIKSRYKAVIGKDGFVYTN